MEKSKVNSKSNAITSSADHVMVQRKLAVGAVNDPLEHEADTIADKVMRMPDPGFVQRKGIIDEEDEKKNMIQRKPLLPFIQKKGTESGTKVSNPVANQINETKGNGSGLDNHVKSFMESRFGTDFSQVRVHTDHRAAAMAGAINAQAFTYGNDIYFNKGKYSPDTAEGKNLLAHELTHTIQQGGTSTNNILQRREALTLGDDYTASTDDSYWVMGAPSYASGHFPPASQTADVDADSSGYVSLVCLSLTHESNWTFDGIGSALFIASVLYEVSETGRLSFINVEIDNKTNGGFRLPAPVIVINANAVSNGQSGVITITHLFGDATSMTTGMNASIGIPPLTIGGNMSGSVTSQSNFFKQYNLYLHVNPIEPVTYTPDIHFRVDSDQVVEGEEVRLSDWFLDLPSSLQRQIREGKRQILITGLASTTGNVAHNRDLSLRRARRVESILSSLAGERANIDARGMGEIPTRRVSEDGTENPAYRIARITILPPVSQ
jgi:hypothetical protein